SRPVKSGQVGLLPGSRRQEVERMLPGMLGAARHLHSSHSTTTVVAGITGLCDYKAMINRYGGPEVSLVLDDARRVIHESQVVLTASGTATLETGVIGRPMVIVYKTGFITYQIARWLVKLEMIGLVNLVLGEKVLPELIQRQATPSHMAAEVSRLLTDESYRSEVTERLRAVPSLLGGPGASARTAEIVGQFL
ncbi:MAG: lipid-A-disaccharide synthase, partial [Candidatus Zixiibacteriota bacterium]